MKSRFERPKGGALSRLSTPYVPPFSGGAKLARCPLSGVRLLTLPATHGGPRRRKVRSVSFPPKGGENSTRSLAPPFPTEPASLGFGGGPIFLPSYPAIFYAAYGRLHLVFKPGGLHP